VSSTCCGVAQALYQRTGHHDNVVSDGEDRAAELRGTAGQIDDDAVERLLKLVDQDDCGSRVDLDAGVERFFGRQHGKLRSFADHAAFEKDHIDTHRLFETFAQPRPGSISRANEAAGQTSIGQLRHLPLRTFKIDRSLVRDAVINACSRKILNSLKDSGHELQFIVVA